MKNIQNINIFASGSIDIKPKVFNLVEKWVQKYWGICDVDPVAKMRVLGPQNSPDWIILEQKVLGH